MDLIGAVEQHCRAGLGDRELRTRILATIARSVPFDAHVFAMTDPLTGIASSPHATVPTDVMARLPLVIRRRYASEDAASWRIALRGFGVEDAVLLRFDDRYGAWGWLELWRTGGIFTDAERAMLDRLTTPVTAGLRAALAATFRDPEPQRPGPDAGVVLLDTDLQVLSQTDSAARALLQLLPPDQPMPPVPAAAYNVGAALLAREEHGRRWEPSTRVHLGANRWVSVRAARLGADIAVSIAPATTIERADLIARAHGLSPRETEVLGLAVQGLDSRAIAERLVIAPTTAEDHLKAVLAKTGVPGRPVLLARVLGA